MGSVRRKHTPGNMHVQVISISVLVLASTAVAQKTPHNLPVLFQYEDPSHSVAVFRGAELRQAIAAGLVPGLGDLGRSGKSVGAHAPPPTAAPYVPPPPPVPSQLELAEQACVQACRNLAGQ